MARESFQLKRIIESLSIRMFDVFALTAIAVSLLASWSETLDWSAAQATRVIYVSPNGSAFYRGNSPDSPLSSIQSAVNRSRPGDRIVLLPGVYFERVHLRQSGTSEAPITLEAEQPGTAVISWACSDADVRNEDWVKESDGLYSARTNWPVYCARDGEETLYRVPWGGSEALRKLAERPEAWGAFVYVGDRLFVALRGGRSPLDHPLMLNRLVPGPREWGEFRSANVWIEGDHLILRGLRMECGIGAAVNVWSGQHIAIEDCVCSGATFGILAGTGVRRSDDLTVRRCLYHNYPQRDWRNGWMTWNEVYASYASSTLLRAVDDNTRVEDCLIVHGGDALRLSSRDIVPATGILAEGNCIALSTDDAFEFDGPAQSVSIRSNLVFDVHESLGCSPVLTGPVEIRGNWFLHPSDGINGAQVKLIGNDTGPPELRKPIRNIRIADNLFVGNWLCWTDRTPVRDVEVVNNVFLVIRATDPVWPAGVIDQNNVYHIHDADDAGDASIAQRLAEFLPEERPGANDFESRYILQFPGPSWFEPESHPATRGLKARVTRAWSEP